MARGLIVIMGVISSTLTRAMQRFNVENRAMRAIERKNPVLAPKHATATKYFDEIIRETPEVRKELDNKDVKLEKYLKDIFVTSTGSMPAIPRNKSLLPQKRDVVIEDEFGFWQPEEIPKGKASLGQILQFLSKYQISGYTYNAEAIAKEYGLEEKVVADVLEFYRPLNMHLPPSDKQNRKGMYSLSRLTNFREKLKLIETSDEKENPK